MTNEDNLRQENLVYTQNRELSWLNFNERILEEAEDSFVPALERLKFVSIYATNLDEFFMVRVGSLYDKSIYTPLVEDNKSGMTPAQQLQKIYDRVRIINVRHNQAHMLVEFNLRSYGICNLNFNELDGSEKKYIKKLYQESIYPILSPQIVSPTHPFPHLDNKGIYVAVLLKHKNKVIFGIVPVPKRLPPFIFLPSHDYRYIHVENIILEFVDTIFDTYEVIEKACICVTRNADISPDDDSHDENLDFRNKMKELLHLRKRLAIVRLETSKQLSTNFMKYLCDKFSIAETQVYTTQTPLKFNYVFPLIDHVTEKRNKNLIHEPLVPVNPTEDMNMDLISLMARKDVLLHYPYVSMKPFLHLIRQASHDPRVVSIKITIYRLAMKATLVDYLCYAAENGKDVTVLIELRARFDEQNNIDWSEKLEEAGCNIIYGFEDYKVHSKVCLITYRDKGKINYITQIGTGNYHEKTAELYTDLSYITGNHEIGLDAAEYFTNVSIGNLQGQYEHLLVAPRDMKPKLLELIDEEIEKGFNGKILIKINSITDIDMINKLSEASQAGVDITMIVRGICCILPGIPNMTENIKIQSIVGRFLEHSRIFSFGKGNDQKLYISSADMMTRNLERRVEVACPIYDSDIKKEINEILEILLYDDVKSRIIDSIGNYTKKEDRKAPINSQELFIRRAKEIEYEITAEPFVFKWLATIKEWFKKRVRLP
ncbi:MAG: polyphosphate kinase 1 [Clostridiales bacterium]|nr:polyphosphate kinase 1 [Clostridiales bacterium]